MKKGGDDIETYSKDPLSPKIMVSNPIIEKRVPLKGFPAIQANTATENNGRLINTPISLLEGFHFVISIMAKTITIACHNIATKE